MEKRTVVGEAYQVLSDPQKKAAQPDVVESVEQVETLDVDIVQGQDA